MNDKFIEKENEKYRKINDIKDYLDQTPYNVCVNAKKNGYIMARPAEDGERISVMTSDGHKEAQEVAKPGDWVATRAYENGTPHVDEHGNVNSWLMSEDTLAKKYNMGQKLENGERMFAPRGEEQKFMRVSENVALSVPWGENGAPIDQYIKEGGWLNITNENDIYGIAEQEFFDTYDRTYTHQRQGKNGEYTEYDEKVDETIFRDTWQKSLDRMKSLGVEYSNPEFKKHSVFDIGDGTVDLKNGIKMHVSCPLSGEGYISAYEKDGALKYLRGEKYITEENIDAIESLKTMPYKQYFENMINTYFPEKAEDLMAELENIEFPHGAEKPVFYRNEPDRETAVIAVDALEKASSLIDLRTDYKHAVDDFSRMPHETQAERVAVLKKATELYKEKNEVYSETDRELDYEELNKASEKGMYQPALYISSAIDSISFGKNDAIHDMTNKAINELFGQLSADTQGVTHDEVQKNFDKYEIPGLDSVQYLTDNYSSHYDLVQLTLSDEQYFNADAIRIPSELIDNLPSAMAAAAKYSQTQAEFEEEGNGTPYEETYHSREETSYKECSASFEPLGNARTDDEIGAAMYAAAGSVDRNDTYAYDAYMHAVEVLDNAGIDGLKAEIEERNMTDQEWEENEKEAPEYDDDDLEL